MQIRYDSKLAELMEKVNTISNQTKDLLPIDDQLKFNKSRALLSNKVKTIIYFAIGRRNRYSTK